MMIKEEEGFNAAKMAFQSRVEKVRKYTEENDIFDLNSLFYHVFRDYDNKPKIKSGILDELKLYLKRGKESGYLRESPTDKMKYETVEQKLSLKI